MSDLNDLIEDLKRKRDELRLQMHLAGKEAKEEWNELEDKMKDFAQRAEIEKTGEGISSALAALGGEIKQGYARVRKAVKDDD